MVLCNIMWSIMEGFTKVRHKANDRSDALPGRLGNVEPSFCNIRDGVFISASFDTVNVSNQRCVP